MGTTVHTLQVKSGESQRALISPVSGIVKDRECLHSHSDGLAQAGITGVTEKGTSSGREKSISSETPPALTGPGASWLLQEP